MPLYSRCAQPATRTRRVRSGDRHWGNGRLTTRPHHRQRQDDRTEGSWVARVCTIVTAPLPCPMLFFFSGRRTTAHDDAHLASEMLWSGLLRVQEQPDAQTPRRRKGCALHDEDLRKLSAEAALPCLPACLPGAFLEAGGRATERHATVARRQPSSGKTRKSEKKGG